MDAAVALFAARGITTVSVRQVAATAGVNPGLVSRYVGTKDDLVRAALARAGAEAARQPDRPFDPDPHHQPLDLVGAYARILAHLSVEGYDLSELVVTFPLTTQIVDRLVAEGLDPHEAGLRAVCSLALASWRLLSPLVSLAAELDAGDVEAMDEEVEQTRRWLVQAPPDPMVHRPDQLDHTDTTEPTDTTDRP